MFGRLTDFFNVSGASYSKDTSHIMSADSSFDMMGSILPAGQRQTEAAIRTSLSGDRMTPDLFASSSISSTAIVGLPRDEVLIPSNYSNCRKLFKL